MGYQLLILEDNKADARLLKEYLKRSDESYDKIDMVHRKDEYVDALQSKEYDLILSDFRLIGFNGIDAIRIKNKYCPNVPLIIVSATVGDENAAEIIKEGAVDFLIKDKARERLGQVAKRAIRESQEHTKRREAEKQLKRNERHYRLLFNSIQDGIVIGEPKANSPIIDVNPALCDLLGYRREELLSMKREELLDLPDAQIEDLLTKRDKHSNYMGEMRLKHKEGHGIPVEVSSRMIELDDGLKRSYNIIRDISERKKAEAKQEQHQQIQELQRYIAQIVNKNVEFEKSLQLCLEQIRHFLEWDIGHIYLKEPNGSSPEYHSLKIWSVDNQGSFEPFKSSSENSIFHTKEGMIGQVAGGFKPISFQIQDSENDYLRAQTAYDAGLRTGLLIPVNVKDEMEAVLEFYSRNEEAIDDRLFKVFEALATQIGQLIERKRSFENLEKEKELYRLLAQNSTDMISKHTPDGVYTYASPASERLMGYSPDELIGTQSYDYFHPDDRKEIRRHHHEILESLDISNISYRIKQKNGGWRWVETINRVLRDPETGEPSEILATTRSITEQKSYERELKKQVDLNKKIINSQPELFFIVSEDQHIERYNEQFRRKLGYGQEEAATMHPADFVVDSDRPKVRDAIEQAFETGQVEVELTLVSKSGNEIPCLFSGTVNELDGDDYLLGTGIDITERVEAERELRKEKEFVDKAINSLPGLFYVIDNEGNYDRVNDNFITDLGYSWEEIQQMEPLDFYLEDDHERVQQAIQQAFTEGEATLTARLKTQNGELPWYYLTGTYISQDQKEYILGTGIDITERKNLENLLQQAQKLARIGAWELDLINDEISWTPVTKQIHEVPPDYQPDREGALKFYKEGESRDTIKKAVANAINYGTPYDVTVKIVTARGNERWVRTIGQAEFKEGQCIKLYGSFQDIHARKMAEENLKASLKEKEVLLQEIHHRVKNNLAVVSSMMQLQAFESESDEAINQLINSQNRIQSIAVLHELLYETKSFSQINFAQNVRKIAAFVAESMQSQTDVDINFDLEPVVVNVNQAIPCSLILNELLTNAYKHAFPDASYGKIFISLKERDGKIELKLIDNGVGLDNKIQADNVSTIGFKIVNVLTEQLEGELECNAGDQGTEFILNFDKINTKGSASSLM